MSWISIYFIYYYNRKYFIARTKYIILRPTLQYLLHLSISYHYLTLLSIDQINFPPMVKVFLLIIIRHLTILIVDMRPSLRKYFSTLVIKRNTNQALQLAKFAIAFLQNGNPAPQVLQRTKMFHTDSVICGLSAIALKANAPYLLREEALQYNIRRKLQTENGKVFGSNELIPIEKAIVANCSAVREWDSNGTVFGFDTAQGRQAGQFGHNDFYPVIIAATNVNRRISGAVALKAMVLQDQIRGRLCEVFSLKDYKIDHVVHGAIASICVYGALVEASPQAIQHAIGMFVAHYTPWRAIRAGNQLSDSKGASAALSTEAAIMCIKRAMRGFVGPKDIFRNPQALFRYFQKTSEDSPFDINLTREGNNFAVMGMHFKLGLYEHQSASALEGLQTILLNQKLTASHKIDEIQNIGIIAYKPAFSIIGDPAKRSPTTRQSADHSMVYIVSTILKKAFTKQSFKAKINSLTSLDEVWKELMLEPKDYSKQAIFDPTTRDLMSKCTFSHGGSDYDKKYPEGIPTSVSITLKNGKKFESGLVMFPSGHARNANANLKDLLSYKNNLLGKLALHQADLSEKLSLLDSFQHSSNSDLQNLYCCRINFSKKSIDSDYYKP